MCPALLAPETQGITPRRSSRPTALGFAACLADAGGLGGGGTALILDLEPSLGVCIAARLNELRVANAVLLLPRWPYRKAVLPVAELLDSLVSQAARLTPGNLRNVTFVLDAERSRAVPHRSRRDIRADNRYRLSVADLPNLSALRARAITKVVKLSAA